MDADAHVVGVSTIARDVSERKRAYEVIRNLNASLERRVQERTAELEAANKDLEAFAYSVSHDLRTPLRAMDGFSAQLRLHLPEQLDEQSRHCLDRIQAASLRMGGLIDDLLGLSRVTRHEIALRRLDLGAMAREIVAELQARDPERAIELVIADDMVVEGDAHLLRIALTNLLGNAWKFSGPTDRARIEVGVADETVSGEAREGDGSRVFFVRDNGVGFDMDFADKLFVPFQRLHDFNEFAGTGIGLAIVSRVVTRHEGRIWGEGAVGGGATFFFTLGGTDV